MVIFDESHFIKNKQAQRTKFSVKLAKKTGKVLFLTGTPVLNKPIEVYNVLNIVSPTGYWEFCMRYCGAKKTQWGWDLGGASHLDELRRKMYFMIRRTKEQVLSELPDKTVSVLDTSISPEGKKEYRKIQKEFREWLIENGKNINALYAEALTKVGYLKQVVVRHKNIEEIIENFLESGKKIIVFSQYVEIIERLSKQYVQESVALTGATPTKDRQGIIDEFQNNPEKRIFLSTLKAGGVGITLTAADTVLFTDLDWVPANHLQAEDRAHRIGQKNNVNVYYLITPDTIEEEIWKLLRRKEKVVNQILDGKEDVRRVHITSLLKKI